MKLKLKRSAWVYALPAVLVYILVIVLFVNILALSYKNLVTQYFGQTPYKEIATGEQEGDTQYFKSDYTSMADLQADQTVFATQVQAEGAVLLQNKNLPLDKKSKITLLGSGSSDEFFLVGGGGSGRIDTSKKPSLETVFTDAGFEVNPVMLEFYAEGNGKSTRGSGSNYVGEAPQSAYSQTEISSYADYSDAGIIILGRTGQEGKDVFTYTAEDADKHMLELSANELDLINSALKHFDKVVILLNTMNPVELGPLENLDVSVMWIGAGGQQGLRAIPGLLDGTYNPSGRLVDTYAYDNFSSPAMVNFGDFRFSDITDTYKKYYYNYAENIYIGYKYYETRYADYVMGTANVGEFDYSEEVQYPYGYGLSYTTFEYTSFDMTEKQDEFVFDVTVKNTGSVPGKEVVEIYMQSPYTQYDRENLIEKSAIELVGFAKTDKIESGKTDSVTISVPKEYMCAYDAKTAKTYIVDAGDYYFTVGRDAHDAVNNVLAALGYSKADGMTDEGNDALVEKYTQSKLDSETYSVGADGEKITNQFDYAPYTYYDDSFVYLTRNNWTGTWPEPLATQRVEDSAGDYYTMEAGERLREDIITKVVADDPEAVAPVTGADNGLTLASLIGVDYDSDYWNKLLDQMTPREMMSLVGNGGFGTVVVESISKPSTVEKDGPAGISSTLIGGVGCFGYPIAMVFASTWNLELEEQLGHYFGDDAILSRVSGIYAPSINMHRTPFSGRNFEYFSEDSFQSGIFAATMIKAVQEKGVYCYTKHFALNDQELNRDAAATFATEQTVREIYLRPFEIAVRNGGSKGMMVAKNRIGTVWCGVNKNLLTNVLRNEWGFRGSVITDGLHAYSDEYIAKTALDAGLDIYLCTAQNIWDIQGFENNASVLCDLRNACHNILYNIANSLAMNNIGANVRIVEVMPGWEIAMIVADVVVVLAVATGMVFSFRKIFKNRKEGR